jgi:hypothetical protein
VNERSTCRECERLGREYGDLTISHVALEERFISAKRRHNHELASVLVRQMHDLALEMARRRQAMRDHGNETHPDRSTNSE